MVDTFPIANRAPSKNIITPWRLEKWRLGEYEKHEEESEDWQHTADF
jgi:hypothetical protein